MCAYPRFPKSAQDAPGPVPVQPEAELDSTRPYFLVRRPGFLSRRARNARAVLIGGAALTGGALLGAAAVAAAGVATARRAVRKRLRGQTVLITGSSRGLGLALAEQFARHGGRIVLTARDRGELERARDLLLERKACEDIEQIMLFPADLRKQEEAESLVRRATETFGHIDILVNNAGIITVGPVENQTVQDFREVMDTNFFSAVHCTLAVLPQMIKRRGGAIVNIASIGGKVAMPHLLPYTASKFAAVGFSEGLHSELRSKGVHVLTVCPGLMRTGSHLNALFSGDAAREYRWFSFGASAPGISTSADSAARRIVRALLGGETEIAITPQAILAARLAQISPELTTCVTSLVNRVLPSPTEQETKPTPGKEVRTLESLLARRFGWSAANRLNQV